MSDPVTASTVESAIEKGFYEWLAGYFNGAAHVVSGQSVVFPQASILTGLAEVPAGVSIQVVWENRGGRSYRDDATPGTALYPAAQSAHEKRYSWSFRVRCAGNFGLVSAGNANSGNEAYLRRKAMQLLRAIVEDASATIVLARLGIRNLRVRKQGPVSAADPNSGPWAADELVVDGTVEYVVPVAA